MHLRTQRKNHHIEMAVAMIKQRFPLCLDPQGWAVEMQSDLKDRKCKNRASWLESLEKQIQKMGKDPKKHSGVLWLTQA